MWGVTILNDGHAIPHLAWGSWTAGAGDTVVEQVEQAIEAGFTHIDSAQYYSNEREVGKGIHASGEKVYLTTKWSGKDGKGIMESLHESLELLGVKKVDLYLIHSPRLTKGDPAAAWAVFEQIKKEGYSKSIGVSNFKIDDLEAIRYARQSTPAVNQIILHPYVYAETIGLLDYHERHNIVTEAYSPLYPITHSRGGPLDKHLKELASKHKTTEAGILYAWTRAKKAIVVTTSKNRDHLNEAVAAGDVELSEEDIKTIDKAGAKFHAWQSRQRLLKTAPLALFGVGGFVLKSWWLKP